MLTFFEALLHADDEPIVICNMEHSIVFMNATAMERYAKRGGKELVGKSIFDCHNAHSKEIILSVVEKFLQTPDLTKVYTYTKNWDGEDTDVYMVALRDTANKMIGYYEKHESRIHERERL
ncbi:MAG: PAS domain-containing protein [Firmicutes bacterium]|nr:PAS domain-containing protein [Bacillota bacterium]